MGVKSKEAAKQKDNAKIPKELGRNGFKYDVGSQNANAYDGLKMNISDDNDTFLDPNDLSSALQPCSSNDSAASLDFTSMSTVLISKNPKNSGNFTQPHSRTNTPPPQGIVDQRKPVEKNYPSMRIANPGMGKRSKSSTSLFSKLEKNATAVAAITPDNSNVPNSSIDPQSTASSATASANLKHNQNNFSSTDSTSEHNSPNATKEAPSAFQPSYPSRTPTMNGCFRTRARRSNTIYEQNTLDTCPYQFTRQLAGNGGLKNAVKRAMAEGDIDEVLWVGSPGLSHFSSLGSSRLNEITQRFKSEHNCVPVYVDETTFLGHYNHYCKQILWPTMHYQVPDNPNSKAYQDHSWTHYQAFNQAVADQIVSVYKDGDIVWINDYHLLLVAGMVREKLPNAKIGVFLHIAFPSSEVFRVLAARRQLLEGMIAANCIGFQISEYSRHFLQTCNRILAVDTTPNGIRMDNRFISVIVDPIGIDPVNLEKSMNSGAVNQWRRMIWEKWPEITLIVSRDKLDKVRGIKEKLLAYEQCLKDRPELVGKVVLIQVCLMNQSDKRLESDINVIVDRINSLRSDLSVASPCVFLHQDIDFSQYIALLIEADAFAVTSVREGMNLTCHEFVFCNERFGPLILSEFTGAASDLGSASLLINPWDRKEMAEAFYQAIIMDPAEKKERWNMLYEQVVNHNCLKWANTFLNDVEASWAEEQRRKAVSAPLLDMAKFREDYQSVAKNPNKKRIFFLDLDTANPLPLPMKPNAPHKKGIMSTSTTSINSSFFPTRPSIRRTSSTASLFDTYEKESISSPTNFDFGSRPSSSAISSENSSSKPKGLPVSNDSQFGNPLRKLNSNTSSGSSQLSVKPDRPISSQSSQSIYSSTSGLGNEQASQNKNAERKIKAQTFQSPQRKISVLYELVSDPQNIVYVVSSDSRASLERFFRRVAHIGLIANGGLYLKKPRSSLSAKPSSVSISRMEGRGNADQTSSDYIKSNASVSEDGWISLIDWEKTNEWKTMILSLLDNLVQRVQGIVVHQYDSKILLDLNACPDLHNFDKIAKDAKRNGKADAEAAEPLSEADSLVGDLISHINDVFEANYNVHARYISEDNMIEISSENAGKLGAIKRAFYDECATLGPSNIEMVVVAGAGEDERNNLIFEWVNSLKKGSGLMSSSVTTVTGSPFATATNPSVSIPSSNGDISLQKSESLSSVARSPSYKSSGAYSKGDPEPLPLSKSSNLVQNSDRSSSTSSLLSNQLTSSPLTVLQENNEGVVHTPKGSSNNANSTNGYEGSGLNSQIAFSPTRAAIARRSSSISTGSGLVRHNSMAAVIAAQQGQQSSSKSPTQGKSPKFENSSSPLFNATPNQSSSTAPGSVSSTSSSSSSGDGVQAKDNNNNSNEATGTLGTPLVFSSSSSSSPSSNVANNQVPPPPLELNHSSGYERTYGIGGTFQQKESNNNNNNNESNLEDGFGIYQQSLQQQQQQQQTGTATSASSISQRENSISIPVEINSVYSISVGETGTYAESSTDGVNGLLTSLLNAIRQPSSYEISYTTNTSS